MLPSDRKDRYDAIKKFCCVDHPGTLCVWVCFMCVCSAMHLIGYDDTILRVVSLCAVNNSSFSLV